MASFFDKFADKVNDLGNKVIDKTTSSTENIRLSSSIKDEERQINDDYISIGKKYREIYGSSPAPEFAGFIADIKKRESLINEYRKKIQQNKGKVTCQNCGTAIDSNAAFCDKCGTKNPIAEQIAREKAETEAKAAAQAAAQAQAAESNAKAQTSETAAETSAASVNNEAENKIFCKNCGSAISAGNVFCTNCGTRVD